MHNTVNSAARKAARGQILNPVAVLLAAISLLLLAMIPPASAQEEGAVGFTQEELQAFASATLEVERVQAKWQPQLAEEENADEVNALRRQAIEEMADAVRGEGLSVGQYNGIQAAAQQNPELMETIMEYRQEMQ